jgi:flagellar hook-associated protein 2
MRIYGLSSGLDTENIIRQLMDLERIPVKKLQARKSLAQVQKDAWKDINRRLSNLDNRLFNLKLASTFTSMKATSSQPAAFTATAVGTALAASYEVHVERLAQAQRVASTQAPDFTVPLSGKFAINGSVVEVGSARSLNDIRAAINNAQGSSVSAAVIDGRLVLTHKETGSAAAITYEYLEGDDILLALGLYDSGTGEALHQELQAAGDAVVLINGLRVESPGNVLKNVISGVDLTLKGKSEVPGRLDVARDTARVLEAVKGFIDQYNSAMDFIAGKLGEGGDLRGDPTLIRVQATLKQLMMEKYGQTEGYGGLMDLGVSTKDPTAARGFNESGKLWLDESLFMAKFNADPEAVRELFAGEGGFAARVSEYARTLITLNTGVLSVREKGLGQSMKVLDEQIERLNQRLELREKQLARQFTALEKALSGVQSQSAWLANQVKNMMGFDSLLR